MAQLAAGHEASLNELMERHGQRLFHYLIRMLRDESDAEDLAQETFVRVYQNRAQFDSTRRFSTWFYAIATNLARDRLRWRERHPQVSLEQELPGTEQSLRDVLPEPGADPGQATVAAERAELVRRAVGALPEELRVPLMLAEYEAQSHAKIGAILNCSPKAVEMRIYRARQQLREALATQLREV